jgi:hypothetical protein
MERAVPQHVLMNLLLATFSEEDPTTAPHTRQAHTFGRSRANQSGS